MKKSYKLAILLIGFIALSFITGCKKEIIYTGNKGDLIGKARIATGEYYIGDSTIKVNIIGDGLQKETFTGKNGIFTFHDIETGIYDLVFSKNSFSTYKIYGYQFIGGNIPEYIFESYYRSIILFKLPDVEIKNLKIDTIFENQFWPTIFRLKATMINAEQFYHYRFYFDITNQVLYNNYIFTNEFFSSLLDSTLFIDISSYEIKGFKPGEKVYLRMYPSTDYDFISNKYYTDKETGVEIFPVNTKMGSEVIDFIFPEINEEFLF